MTHVDLIEKLLNYNSNLSPLFYFKPPCVSVCLQLQRLISLLSICTDAGLFCSFGQVRDHLRMPRDDWDGLFSLRSCHIRCLGC